MNDKNIPRVSHGRLAMLAIAWLLPALAPAVETRIALVIGNSAYPSGPLANPANDARLVGDALRQVGFEVIERRNADQRTMKRAIQEFGARLEKTGPQGVGLFYYAGHGVQLDGRNYLIPTTADIEREGDVEIEAVSAEWVIEQMRYARDGLNIVILDACRNNPFTRSLRSATRGLASMQAPAGMYIAYSTAPGEVAADGSGRDSPYTTALTRAMLEVHQPLEELFKAVRVDVIAATGGKQVPWESSSLTQDFYFIRPHPATLAASAAAPPRPEPASASTPASPSVPGSARTAAGAQSGLLARIEDWFTPRTEASRPPPVVATRSTASISGARALTLLQTLGIEAPDLDASREYPAATLRHLIETAPRRVTLGSTGPQILAALALCRQYSPACRPRDYSDERPREAILQPFELDATPVSVAAFRRFADGTGYRTHAERTGFAYAMVVGNADYEERVAGGSWRNALKKRPLEEDSAVVGVSFSDAEAYCRSRDSRLPSEDEWEYAARGPRGQIFPWGDRYSPAAPRSMNVAPRVSDGPDEGIGGRYKGLSGNIWQWVNTWGDGRRRILKGGSWLEPNPAHERAATRRYELPDRADEDSGFRCARTTSTWPDVEVWMSQLR